MNSAANACSEVTFMFKALLTIFWKKPILKGTLKNCLLLSNKVGRRKRGEMRYWLHVVLCSLQNVCAKLCIGSFKTFIFDVPPFFKEPFMVFTDFEISSMIMWWFKLFETVNKSSTKSNMYFMQTRHNTPQTLSVPW